LGRIDDPQQMKAAAAVICGLKLRDKEAASKIKNYRRTMRLPPSIQEALLRESEEQDEPSDLDGPPRLDASTGALESIKLAWKALSKNEQREFLQWLRRYQKRRRGRNPGK